MKHNKFSKNQVISVVVLFVCLLCFLLVYMFYKPQTSAGVKSFEVTVIDDNNNAAEYQGQTGEEYLRGALEELEGFSMTGTESEYGLMVETVNGVRAVYEKDQAYWAFCVNGEYCNNGVDTQPVNDGDHFEIVYTFLE